MCYFLKAYNAEKVGKGRERKGGMNSSWISLI
jgi:hypothetical protein